jgi:hypothetical protein
MEDSYTACRICGEFVLQVPGWTILVHSYRLLRATWEPEHRFFHGALHMACLPDWPHREAFSRELETVFTGTGRMIAVPGESGEVEIEQPGLHFAEEVFRDGTCAVHRNTATDRWLVTTAEGPWYVLDPEQLAALGRGRPARADEGGERVRLPADPGPWIETSTLPGLLDRLGIAHRYPGLLENGAPEYAFWDWYPKKLVLEYSVAVDLPLPAAATEFLARYAHSYQPLSFDEPG